MPLLRLSHWMRRLACAALVTAGLTAAAPLARAADGAAPAANAAKPVSKPLTWYNTWLQASGEARKGDRIILAYNCGSDWDEWTQKLDKEVLNTELFKDWVTKNNIVLFKNDYLKFKSGGPQAKELNEKLKIKYNLSRIPTLLFLDCDGLLIARCGYDTASLREDEERGHPQKWIDYCQEIIENRPPKEKVVEQKSIDEAITANKKHYMPILFLVRGAEQSPLSKKQEAELLDMQPFVRFVNANFVFYTLNVPAETDKKPEAEATRKFMTEFKVPMLKSGLRLVVFDWYKQHNEVRDNLPVRNWQQLDDMIEALDKNVPNPDYNGRWLEDYKEAKFISNRLKRPLLICFTSMDGSEYCQKFFDEVFNTQPFKDYARKNMVLMRVDFPKDEAKKKEQPPEIADQNKQMADTFAIRGYPTVVVLNFMGQRIGDSKYMKGGPDVFIKALDAVVKSDRFSRP